MRILVTGAAGFIGFHLSLRLAGAGHTVVGVDNFNDYYSPQLKRDRAQLLARAGVNVHEADICNAGAMDRLFEQVQPQVVVHLAAQAGVRYSLENPRAYVETNVDGMLNILECCRHAGKQFRQLLYASSSSVYGLNSCVPFSEEQSIAHPVSVYAATKKAGELLAHTYSHLYGIPTTGLRFFTVYGPWGRPDMSPMLFADAIMHGRPIRVFNNGDMERDFTYINDIVDALQALVEGPVAAPDASWSAQAPSPATPSAPYRILNVGNSQPVPLMEFIHQIEEQLGRKAQLDMQPMQPGDVKRTWADTSRLQSATGCKPATPLSSGIADYIKWYKEYYLQTP